MSKNKKQCFNCDNRCCNVLKICIHCGYKFDKKYKSFAEEYPELLKEWDFDKNDINPNNITSNSHKIIHWKCKYNHIWSTKLTNRISGKSGCPFCSGRYAITGQTDLATIYPYLLEEWDYDKNTLNPTEVSAYSNKKAWWICKLGHSWQSIINSRTGKSKNGCPYCSNNKTLKGFNDLETLYPELIKEWDFSQNNIKPADVRKHSNKKVWWKCKIGHKWKTSISSRTFHKTNCPYCSNNKAFAGYNDITTTHPQFLSEWDYEKNIIKPTEILSQSNKKIWWKCDKGHSYHTMMCNKTNKCGNCPYCSGQKVLVGFNDLWTTHPELCEDLVNKDDGYKYSKGSHKKIEWECKKCDYIWSTNIEHRVRGQGCPKCKESHGEKNISKILDNYGIVYIQEKQFDKCIYKKPLKFDFYLPDFNLNIEYQGIQHYPIKFKKSKYNTKHLNYFIPNFKSQKKRDQIKRDFCKKEKIKLLEIPY